MVFSTVFYLVRTLNSKQGRETFLQGFKNEQIRDFPGGPLVKTSCSQCRGRGFNPWSGN